MKEYIDNGVDKIELSGNGENSDDAVLKKSEVEAEATAEESETDVEAEATAEESETEVEAEVTAEENEAEVEAEVPAEESETDVEAEATAEESETEVEAEVIAEENEADEDTTEGQDDVSGNDGDKEPVIDEGELYFEEDGEEEDEVDEPEEKPSFVRGLFEIIEMFGIAIAVVVLIITFFFRFSNVEGESMTYTIDEKDTLLVSMAFYKPQRGDVVIFQAPDYDVNKPLVKRVIAVEGDLLEINFKTWEVKVNGAVLDEDYIRYHPYLPKGDDLAYKQLDSDWHMDAQSISRLPQGEYDPVNKVFTAVIPEGHIFAMGDNRNNSHDSRSSDIGMVDERYIVGKVICRILPFESFGPID